MTVSPIKRLLCLASSLSISVLMAGCGTLQQTNAEQSPARSESAASPTAGQPTKSSPQAPSPPSRVRVAPDPVADPATPPKPGNLMLRVQRG
ncbi:MAG: hypothetical protein ACO21Q_04625, partial [Burkholderiaceae bacterium]